MADNVRLTKFAHSCVLVEYQGKTVLFDPGNYGWESCQSAIEGLQRLDTIAITHEHPDHFYPPFVTALIQKFPNLKVVSSPEVLPMLKGVPAANIAEGAGEDFQFFNSPHEGLYFGQSGPANAGIHFAGVFSHPGDSHSFSETKQILAMPMTAPWGSMVDALAKITELRPKYVLPIHDWHWRPDALEPFYERFKETLAAQGITFLMLHDGHGVEIPLV